MPLGGCAQREEEVPMFIGADLPFYGHSSRAGGREVASGAERGGCAKSAERSSSRGGSGREKAASPI